MKGDFGAQVSVHRREHSAVSLEDKTITGWFVAFFRGFFFPEFITCGFHTLPH